MFSSTFGSQARNNLIPNKNSSSENNSNNNNNNNNSAPVARGHSDVMGTATMPNHSNDDSVYSHRAIKEQQDTAFMAAASIERTKESEQKNSTENERGNLHYILFLLHPHSTVFLQSLLCLWWQILKSMFNLRIKNRILGFIFYSSLWCTITFS